MTPLGKLFGNLIFLKSGCYKLVSEQQFKWTNYYLTIGLDLNFMIDNDKLGSKALALRWDTLGRVGLSESVGIGL